MGRMSAVQREVERQAAHRALRVKVFEEFRESYPIRLMRLIHFYISRGRHIDAQNDSFTFIDFVCEGSTSLPTADVFLEATAARETEQPEAETQYRLITDWADKLQYLEFDAESKLQEERREAQERARKAVLKEKVLAAMKEAGVSRDELIEVMGLV